MNIFYYVLHWDKKREKQKWTQNLPFPKFTFINDLTIEVAPTYIPKLYADDLQEYGPDADDEDEKFFKKLCKIYLNGQSPGSFLFQRTKRTNKQQKSQLK